MIRKGNKICFLYFLIISLVLFVIQIFVTINENHLNSNSVNKSLDYYKTTVKWSEYQIIPKKNQKLILVLGEARSGTSFLADLIHQSWATFYAFEPLFSMKLGINLRNNQTNSQKALDILTKIFDCDFKPLKNFEKILWKSRRNKVIQKYPGVNETHYWNKTINDYVCERCDNVLIKSIRISVKQFIELQQILNREIKLIFNVRDPRGVINSRYGSWMEWCYNDMNCASVEILCQRIREDLYYLRELHKIQPGMVSLVRSEDLSLKPYKTGKALFGRLGLEFNPGIEKWIERHTNDRTHLKDPYSSGRQSKDIPFLWTKKLNSSKIKLAEDSCSDIMQLLGYNLFNFTENDKVLLNSSKNENLLSANFVLDYLRP